MPPPQEERHLEQERHLPRLVSHRPLRTGLMQQTTAVHRHDQKLLPRSIQHQPLPQQPRVHAVMQERLPLVLLPRQGR